MSGSEDYHHSDVAVSVIIPCFNQGEYILEAIASVESCQDNLYEIVIVNDGSTDPIAQKVLTYLKEKGYQVIEQHNQGLAAARNAGIKKAKGRYILPLDADNRIKPEYITKSVEILDKMPEIGVVYSDVELFGEKRETLDVPEFDVNKIVAGNYIDACAVFRKAVWHDCGGYDSKIPKKLGYEDWDFWLGAAEKGWQFYHISKVLFEYRFKFSSMVSACNIPENRQELFRYISTKHIGLYATNFANILAQKECELLQEKEECKKLKRKLNRSELKLELSRSQLGETEAQLQEIQAQLLETEAQLEEWRDKIEQYEDELERSQESQPVLETEIEQLQLQLKQTEANYQADLANQERSHAEEREILQRSLAQIRAELQAQLDELARSSQQQLQQTHADFTAQLSERDRIGNELQNQLHHVKAQLEQSQIAIAAMKTSKFWKLRSQWFKLKKTFGLAKDLEVND